MAEHFLPVRGPASDWPKLAGETLGGFKASASSVLLGRAAGLQLCNPLGDVFNPVPVDVRRHHVADTKHKPAHVSVALDQVIGPLAESGVCATVPAQQDRWDPTPDRYAVC